MFTSFILGAKVGAPALIMVHFCEVDMEPTCIFRVARKEKEAVPLFYEALPMMLERSQAVAPIIKSPMFVARGGYG